MRRSRTADVSPPKGRNGRLGSPPRRELWAARNAHAHRWAFINSSLSATLSTHAQPHTPFIPAEAGIQFLWVTRKNWVPASAGASGRKTVLPSYASPRRQDRLRRIAERFHFVVGVEEADDAAGAAFQAFVPPRKRADDAAFVEHQLDVAAQILRVQ